MNTVKPNLVILGESPVCNTGFGKVTKSLARRWANSGAFSQVVVYASNYQGETHHEPYLVYPGEPWWIPETHEKVSMFLNSFRAVPTVIWVIQEAWRSALLAPVLSKISSPKILYTPVDGLLAPKAGNVFVVFDRVVTCTEYGQTQFQNNFNISPTVIPHGIEPTVKPTHEVNVRQADSFRVTFSAKEVFFPDWVQDKVMLSYIATNSPRKDPYAALEMFRCLRKLDGTDRFKLYMHMPSDGSNIGGYDLRMFCRDHGLAAHVTFADTVFGTNNPIGRMSDEHLYAIMTDSDICINTSLGEGWCMPIHEAMACGTTCAVPQHTVFPELYSDTEVLFLPLSNRGIMLTDGQSMPRPMIDTEESAKVILDAVNSDSLSSVAEAGKEKATRPELSWDAVAAQWLLLFQDMNLIS